MPQRVLTFGSLWYFLEGRSGAVDGASYFGPRDPWVDSAPVHISL